MVERYNFSSYYRSAFTDKSLVLPALEERLMYCVVDEKFAIGKGYGFAYTPEMSQALLEKPLAADYNLLSVYGRLFFENAFFKTRLRFDVSGERLAKSDEWYIQGLEPTCVPWSIVNGLTAIGQQIDPVLLTDLLNEANAINGGGGGLTDAKIQRILSNHPDSGFNIFEIHKQYYDFEEYPKLIKRAIDDGKFVMETMSGRYMGDPDWDAPLHQVSLVGYETTYSGVMDVQVMDSALGVLMMPVEHLYKSRSRSLLIAGAKLAA